MKRKKNNNYGNKKLLWKRQKTEKETTLKDLDTTNKEETTISQKVSTSKEESTISQEESTISHEVNTSLKESPISQGVSTSQGVGTISQEVSTISPGDIYSNQEKQTNNESRNESIEKLYEMLPTVISEFEKNNMLQYLVLLFTLVVMGTFDFSNICFLLFCDVLRFWSTKSTNMMRYPFKATQQFWWLGKMLFHGRFHRFMSGYKHAGQGSSTLNPITAKINFAVPSHIHIDRSQIALTLPDIKGPGIIPEMLSLISTKKNNSFVLTFDGKKLAPGLTDQEGDVNLLGCGDEPLAIQRDNLANSLNKITETIQSIKNSVLTGNTLCNSIKEISLIVSNSIRTLRLLVAKQQFAFDKFTDKAVKEPGKNYSYVIDSVKTAIYRAKSTIKDALIVNDRLFNYLAHLHGSVNYFSGKLVNLSESKSFVRLKEPTDVRTSLDLGISMDIPSHLTKQRTDEWHKIRQTVKITGSTAHRGLGGDGLKAEKETYQYINKKIEKPKPTDQQELAMKHGQENEIHALATLHSKVIPALFHDMIYFEEGVHMIQFEGQDRIAVSPDGSLRSSMDLTGNLTNISYAVECKYPYSSYKYTTPVYYQIPKRYICQTMLEMRSMGCQECVFLCWTDESTTVFKIKLNQRLLALILNETNDVYYCDKEKPPSRLSWRAKEIKDLCSEISKQCEFIGEFPSLRGNLLSNDEDSNTSFPYLTGKGSSVQTNQDISENEIVLTLLSASKVVKEAYQLNRKKASEIIPIMLSSVDRFANPETGHAIPIGYFLRGYSLSTEIMRNIAEDFMQACHENNIHVPVQTFDGQWINLVVRDQFGNPQTKLQLQVDVWKEAKHMTKAEIIKKLKVMNKNVVIPSKSEGEPLTLTGYESHLPQTNISLLTSCTTNDNNDETLENSQSFEIVSEVLDSVMTDELNATEGMQSDTEKICIDLGDSIDDTILFSESSVIDETAPDTFDTEHDSQCLELCNQTEENSTVEEKFGDLQQKDFESILQIFVALKRSEFWTNKSAKDVQDFLKYPNRLIELRDYELKELMKFIEKNINSKRRIFQMTVAKKEKVKQLNEFLMKKQRPILMQRRKPKTIASLQDMCTKVLTKKDYPKEALSASFAGYLYYIRLNKWVQRGVISDPLYIDNVGHVSPYYQPEFSRRRNQIEVKVVDGTHIRNNLRAALCKDKIRGIRKEAWMKVAKRKDTTLNLSLLELQADGKVLDQQNEAYTRSLFTTEAQTAMLDFNDKVGNPIYKNEATFCELVRNWIRAEDEPGLTSKERLLFSVSLRNWLLKDVNFGTFPPKTQFIKGIPRVTFESILCSVDAHIYLYELTKSRTYNWRAISSLVAETFMSDIDYMDNWARNGVLTAHGAQMHMKTVCAIHAVQHDPERTFHMRIAAAPVYRAIELDVGPNDEFLHDASIQRISNVFPSDHVFDKRSTRHNTTVARISNPDAPARGTQPVRTHYKVDETKILPSKRLGILFEDNDLC